ncbi:MAG: thioredoxin [Muribaculum sp.]|nr:thioredoxin [Muribaculum sp.]
MAFEFTDENVKETIASGKPALIDCWAPWCGPCVSMTPIIEALAEEYDGRVIIGKYNVDEESDLAAEYRIMSIPTMLLFKNGELVTRLAGSQQKATLTAKIEELLG